MLKHLVSILCVLGITTSTLFAQKDIIISGGNSVSSFVSSNGTAYVWGNNSTTSGTGLLGTGGSAAYYSIPQAVSFTGGVKIIQINSGSNSHFLALDSTKKVWAWGNNNKGQCGTGVSSGQNGFISTPTQVSLGTSTSNSPLYGTHWDDGTHHLTNVKVVYAGSLNSFAILDDNRLVAWGGNSTGFFSYDDANGQLGNGNQVDQLYPQFVLNGATSQPLLGVIQISSGDNYAMALVDVLGTGVGTVYTWGNGLTGLLARNATSTTNPLSSTTVIDAYARPARNADGTVLSSITTISAGDVFGAALDTKGYIWTWGNGGWNNATGNSIMNHTGSDPQKVLKGTTTGASNDGTYLLAKSIGGGQGFGMAVTIDGKPVAWGGGGCSDGGATGNGTLKGSNTGAQYIQYAAGSVHSDVIDINRGDLWGFYRRSDGSLWAFGCNSYGQLGLGSTTDQAYAQNFLPPSGSNIIDPKPNVNLSLKDTSVCASSFSITLNSGFIISSTLAPSYNVTWYKNGVSVSNGTVATANSITVSTIGTYSVAIAYAGTNYGVIPFDTAKGSVIISTWPSTFTAPSTLMYCGTAANVNVSSSATTNPVYSWFPTATSTMVLGTSIGSATTTIDPSTTTAGTGTDKVVYVQETSSGSGTFLKKAQSCDPTWLTGYETVSNGAINQNNSYATCFTVTAPLTLTATSFAFQSSLYSTGTSGSATITFTVYGATYYNGGYVVNNTITYGSLTAIYNRTRGSNDPQNIAEDVTATGSVTLQPGLYFIGISNYAGTGLSAPQIGVGNCALVAPIVDDLNGTTMQYNSVSFGTNKNLTQSGLVFDIKFTISQHFCDRIPVTIKQSCPCKTILNSDLPLRITNFPSTKLCPGQTTTLTTNTFHPSVVGGRYDFIWYYGSTTGIPVKTTINNTTATSFFDNYTAVSTLPGLYTLLVRDHDFPNATNCQYTAIISITANPAPSYTITGGGSFCSNTSGSAASININLSGTAPFTLTWTDGTTITTKNGISSSPYVITPTGTGVYTVSSITDANCVGVTSSNPITVTKIQQPDVTWDLTTDSVYCSMGNYSRLTAKINSSATATGGYLFNWRNLTDGNTVTATTNTTSSTIYAPTGTKTYGLTVTDVVNGTSCVQPMRARVITEYALPTYSISGGGTFCSGDTISPIKITIGGGVHPYTLVYKDGAGIEHNVVVAGNNPAIYTIPEKVAGSFHVIAIFDASPMACGAVIDPMKTATIIINSLPQIINAVPVQFCAGAVGTIALSSLFTFSPIGGTTVYSCSTPNTITGSNFINTTTPGIYSISATYTATGCSSSGSNTITVRNLPTILASANPVSISAGVTSTLSASGASSYIWNTGATSTSLTVTPTVTTSYYVTGINANGCSNTASTTVSLSTLKLISGTSFDPLPGNEGKTYNSLGDISYYGLCNGILTVNRTLTPSVTKDVFNATPYYAIVNNPVILDSTRYSNNTTNDYQLIFSPSTSIKSTLLNYYVNGLIPSSSAEVRVSYCSAVSSNYSTCTGSIASVIAVINPDQYNTTNGMESGQIKIGQCGSQTWTTSSLSSNPISSAGSLTYYMSNMQTGQCEAVAIKSIEIWGYPQISIAAYEGTDVCAGSVITLQSTVSYNAAYKWEANNGNGWFTIGTDVTQKYQTSTPGTYTFRLNLTPTDDSSSIISDVLSITASSCCIINNNQAVKQTVFLENFGKVDMTDRTGHTIITTDYTDFNNPKTVTKTTNNAFRYSLSPAPLGATYHGANDKNGLQDGEYCVAGLLTKYNPYVFGGVTYDGAYLAWAGDVTGPTNTIDPNFDHSGKIDGSCLFVNCPPNTSGQTIYSKTVTNLNSGDQLSFECWISVFTNSAAGVYNPVNVNATLTDGGNASNTVTINGTATRQINGGGTWVKISGSLTIAGTSATINITNNSNIAVNGNDLVLDDIKLSRCVVNPVSYDRTWQGVGSWATISNWSNRILPTTLSIITVASGELIIDQNVTVSQIIVAQGAKLTIQPNVTVTISGNLIIQSTSIGTGTLVSQGTIMVNGNTSIQQYLTSGRNWYISSPVSMAQSGVIKSTTGNMLWMNDETTQTWNEIANETTALSVMKGYVANVANNGIVTFTGNLNTGTQTVSNLSRTGTSISNRGFNLIGNPYPAYVNWEMATKTNLESTIWYRTKNQSNAYVFDSYNADSHIGTNNNGIGAVSQYIPSMQAVWVRVNTDGVTGLLTFNSSMQSHQNSNQLKNDIEKSDIRLTVSNGKNNDETILVFNEHASNSFDQFDSEKMFNTNNDVPELFTLADNEKLVINGMNSIDSSKVIPLGFKTAKAGTYTISASEILGLDGIPIVLEDKQLDVTQDLTEKPCYTFSSDSVNDANRFLIHLKADNETTTSKIEQNNVTIYTKGYTAVVNTSRNNAIGTVAVFNLLGQKVAGAALSGTQTFVQLPMISGTYFVRVSTDSIVKTKKIIVK